LNRYVTTQTTDSNGCCSQPLRPARRLPCLLTEPTAPTRQAASTETPEPAAGPHNSAGSTSRLTSSLRAAFAKYLLGANVPERLVYPNTAVDADGDPLTGENTYTLRFGADRIPPVSVFWNMSMYDPGELFIENDFGRYSIGSTTDGLKTDPDGSITILIQYEQPDDTANWLPAPATGPFNLTMHMYGAETPVFEGTYRLPPSPKPDKAHPSRTRAWSRQEAGRRSGW
jgi:hypothetical protein